MAYEIRAMSLAEILDTSFRLVRDQFKLLFGIAMVGYLPMAVGMAAFFGLIDPSSGEIPEFDQEAVLYLVPGVLVYVLVILLLFPFVVVAATSTAAEAYLGKPVSFERSRRIGLAKYLHWVWVFTLFSFYLMGFLLLLTLSVGALVAVTPNTDTMGAVGVGLIIAAVVIGISGALVLTFLLWGFSFMLSTVAVLEPGNARDSIARAWRLCVAARWRLLGSSVVVYLITVIPSSGTQMLIGFLPVVGSLVWSSVQAIAYAYMVTAFVVLYFDILCREEAFDLEHLARTVEGQIAMDGASWSSPPE